MVEIINKQVYCDELDCLGELWRQKYGKNLEVHQEEPEISEMVYENFFESGQLMDVMEPQAESLPNNCIGNAVVSNQKF